MYTNKIYTNTIICTLLLAASYYSGGKYFGNHTTLLNGKLTREEFYNCVNQINEIAVPILNRAQKYNAIIPALALCK